MALWRLDGWWGQEWAKGPAGHRLKCSPGGRGWLRAGRSDVAGEKEACLRDTSEDLKSGWTWLWGRGSCQVLYLDPGLTLLGEEGARGEDSVLGERSLLSVGIFTWRHL